MKEPGPLFSYNLFPSLAGLITPQEGRCPIKPVYAGSADSMCCSPDEDNAAAAAAAILPTHPLSSIAHIDEKNKAIKQLEDELHVRGVAVARVPEEVEGAQIIMEREGARTRGGTSEISPAAPRMSVESRRASGQVEEAQRRARRRTLPRAFSSGKQLLAELSGLRSELQCVTTQVCRATG